MFVFIIENARSKKQNLLKYVYTNAGTHPVCYITGIRSAFSGGKKGEV